MNMRNEKESFDLWKQIDETMIYPDTNIKEANLMPEIIKVFKEEIPTLRFVGKKYDNFGHWDEWWENGWFDLLE